MQESCSEDRLASPESADPREKRSVETREAPCGSGHPSGLGAGPMDEESLFAATLEKTFTADRLAFLEEVCGDDVALRKRIERLLAAHEKTFGILDRPVSPPVSAGDAAGPSPADTLVAGRYKLLEAIGEGGMGTVWVAEQIQPVRRKVAVKLVKAGMDSRSVLARFEVERQALALMDHPNIAKVLDGGEADGGRPFIVMDYVEGVPITRHCDDARLSIAQRLALFVPVCQAVQHAHAKGIIHRDLKPSNVLVAHYDGKPIPKVIDFGVAKATGPKLSERTTLTRDGQLVGTPLYMSPEQAEMGGLDVDTRSDIYSLGALLYELLTGSTPFEKKGLGEAAFYEILWAIREEEPRIPSKRLSTTQELPDIAARRNTEPARLSRLVKGDLDWIVMTALEKDRNRRYQTANALAMDLQRYLADEPVMAYPPSVRYRLRKFVRRHKVPVLAACLVVLALVGGIIGMTWGIIRATDALAATRKSERAATDQLFEALLNRASTGRLSRQMGQRLDSLASLERAARIRPDGRPRDEAIAAMALPDVRRVPIGRTSPPDTAGLAYGGQFGLYARADTRGVISIRRISDDREIRRIDAGPITRAYLTFSPDDRFLLCLGEESTLRVWRVAGGQRVLPDDLHECQAHAFSPDGRRLAVGWQEWILCFDLATGREVKRWRLPTRAHTLAFRPDNRALAVGYSSPKVASVYDAEDGTLLADLPVGAMHAQVVAWHPDGERLAVAGSDPRIQIWDVAARRQVAILAGHVQNVTELTFHPEGGLVASYSWDGVLRLWDPATGRPLLQLPLTIEGRLRFSGDGRWLGAVLHGEQAELLEVTPSREYRTLMSSAGVTGLSYNRGDFSPDGRLLVVGIDEGTHLWDLKSGRELAALPAGTIYTFFDREAGEKEGTSTSGSPRAALLTCGPDGLLRWPVTGDGPRGHRLRLGPPRQLSPLRRAWFGRSPDGRALGAVTVEGGSNKILDLETGTVRQELGVHPNGEVRALSGDGRWAASCGWHSDGVRLWNVGTGQMVREWALGERAFVAFTPDSRALIIAQGSEFSFWDVASLQPILRLRREVAYYPGHVAFSPDGKLMALEMAPAVIHLMEAATGRTVAKLEDPYGDRATWLGFTPDGAQLVVVASYASAIHIWDLRAIRARLKTMNLDWNWPELPPDATGVPAADPLTIEVLPGDLAKPRAIERWRRAVGANPDSANACNNLAWAYLTAPEALRDVKAALPLAEKAARLASGNANFRNTLGVAYYRAGRYREAVDLLRLNLENQEDKYLAYDLYFLAMSHHRLGETAQARDYYEWAVRWARIQRGLTAVEPEELAAFRAEAEMLLRIDRKHDQPRGVGRKRSDAPGP
jgi:eukaryotic-like serine/threonine-protein kinase